jgi:membrane protein required for beta-lactamase induction
VENKNQSLYIPMGLKTRSEIFEGFGKEEIMQVVIATVVIILVAFLIFSFIQSVSFLIVLILVGIAGSVMCVTKDKNNQSVVDHFKNMIRFMREQQKYKYIALKEWGDY